MFTEILKIIPRLDRAALAVMESQLTKRFMRVATRFGKGMEKVMKGNLLFLSLGFITQLLNPLEKIHDKIKDMLGQGSDLDEIAAKFDTTPGAIKRLESVAESIGLAPDRLRDMMSKYADAVEAARKELADPTAQKSDATRAVSEYVNDKDMAQSFFKFLQGLRAQGQRGTIEESAVAGMSLERARQEGAIRTVTGEKQRERSEEAVFGEATYGAARRFIDADFQKAFERIGVRLEDFHSSGSALDKTLQNLIVQADRQRATQTKNELNDFTLTGSKITPKVIDDMEAAAERERKRDRSQFDSIAELQKATKNIDEIKVVLQDLQQKAIEGLGFVSGFIPEIRTFFGEVKGWFETTIPEVKRQVMSVKESILKFTQNPFLSKFFK